MKIILIGDHPAMPSGFGTQLKLLAQELSKKHEVVIICPAIGYVVEMPDLEIWPIANITDTDVVDKAIHKFQPDTVIVFWYIHMISKMTQLRSAPANCSVYYWVPWEASTLPKGHDTIFYGMKARNIVHLSEFAKNLWNPVLRSETIIPHCYNPVFDAPVLDKAAKKKLRRKWAERLRFPLFDDSIVILNMDRNVQHKRWDATYDLIRRLNKDIGWTVQLIAHTKKKGEEVPEVAITGYDLEHLEKLYGIEGKVAYTDFDWHKGFTEQELLELLQISDFRVSTSEGEGFGIPCIEAAMARCPQIVNDTTTMPELFGESEFLVESATTELNRDCLWQVPNVQGMADQINFFCIGGNQDKLITSVERVYNHVKKHFSPEIVASKWEQLLENNYNSQWYEHRWGFQGLYYNQLSFKALAETISKFGKVKVLEIGSFDGKFVEYALSYGLDIQGVEPDVAAIDKASKRAQLNITNADYFSNTPNADVIVITDIFDTIHSLGGVESVQKFLDKICYYPILCIRANNEYKWGIDTIDKKVIGMYLESKGLQRRHDLEVIVQKKGHRLEHQIWQRDPDTSIPSGFAADME